MAEQGYKVTLGHRIRIRMLHAEHIFVNCFFAKDNSDVHTPVL